MIRQKLTPLGVGLALLGVPACEGGILGSSSHSPSGSGLGPAGGTAGGAGAGAGPQGPGAVPEGTCLPARRLRKLSPDQIEATVRALGIDAPVAQRLRDTLSLSDATFSSYATRLDMSQPHVLEIYEAAKDIASAAIAPGGPAESCALPSAAADCVPTLLSSFGKKALRRALTTEELTNLTDLYTEQRKLDDAATSLTTVLRALFMSPGFLFRTELGPVGDGGETVQMTQDEIASSIAYYLTDAPPDAELLAAAERNELGTAHTRAPHVRRLIGSQALNPGLSRFFGEYFRTAAVGSVSARDAALYPSFSSDVARAYGLETQAFFSEVVLNDDARLATLLSAPYVMVNAHTAPFYGLSGVTSEAVVRQTPPAGQRAGILTQASWLTRFAHDKEGNPVSRGRFVRERLMCQTVPPPPPTVNATPLPPDGQRTQRERLAAHASDPTCAGCHQLMDPIGLAFENYDAVGQYRSTELDRPVDASGSLQDSAGVTYSYQNGLELVQQLSESPVVLDCFSRQVYFYAQGLTNDDAGACSFALHAQRAVAAGGSIVDLIGELVSSDEFFQRSKEPL